MPQSDDDDAEENKVPQSNDDDVEENKVPQSEDDGEKNKSNDAGSPSPVWQFIAPKINFNAQT